MSNKKEITSVGKYIDWVNSHYKDKASKKHLFFRGQTNIDYELRPSVLRNNKLNEKEILLDFCNYADTLDISYDKIYQIDRLLCEMQHYELPTRMLDWTVSPLIALFFSCYNDNSCPSKANCDMQEKKDGVIYIFDPWRYSKEFLKIEPSIPNNHQIQILARALMAYGWSIDKIVEYLSKKYIDIKADSWGLQYPYPTVSPFSNDRKIHQRGTFLIWGKDTKCDLKTVDLGTRTIFKCIVPHENKQTILNELNNLYINEYTVYPDFQGMQKLVRSRYGLFNIK